MDKVESNTASSPGPVPPNHVLSRTAGKKREVRTPKLCTGIVTAVEIATDKTEKPYRQMAGATRRKPRSDFDISLPLFERPQYGFRSHAAVYARQSSTVTACYTRFYHPCGGTPLLFPPSKEALTNPTTAWW